MNRSNDVVRMNFHMAFFAIGVLASFILTAASVIALQVSPASYRLSTSPQEQSYALSVTNDAPTAVLVKFVIEGEFADDISLPASVEIPAGESRSVVVSVAYKQRQPGYLESRILVEAKPLSLGTVTATAAVAHVMRLQTPLAGKHLDASLQFSAASVGQEVLFTIPVRNIGSEPIDAVRLELTVADETLQTTAQPLSVGEERNIVLSWTPQQTGEYPLSATVFYDGKKTEVSGSVTVGVLAAHIVGVEPGVFRLGDLFSLGVLVENEWGAVLPLRASAIMSQNSMVVRGESTTVLAGGGSTVRVPVFLPSAGLKPGEANLTVAVQYAQQQVEHNYTAIIGLDSLRLVSISQSDSSSTKQSWLVLTVLLGVCLFAYGIIYLKKHHGRT